VEIEEEVDHVRIWKGGLLRELSCFMRNWSSRLLCVAKEVLGVERWFRIVYRREII
jgi:hypothetical protein